MLSSLMSVNQWLSSILVGPGGFEPPTSTMSRPIGRTKIRVDWSKLTDKTALTQRLLSNFSD